MPLQFDTTYYLQQNPDVLAAILAGQISSAEAHFNQFGAFEGRNPNAIFNTFEYLAANPDVLAAGVNGFQHYLSNGAYEGRAPNATFITFADFDAETYLDSNPDLAAAGIDTALEAYGHFVVFGQFEGRPGAPDAGGNAGEIFTLTERIDAPGINEDQPGSGVDTSGTDGDDLYIGNSQTLNPGDVIDGNGGMDRIELTLGGEGITSDFNDSLASAEVETVQVTGVDGLGSLLFGGVFLNMLEALGVETVVNQSSQTYVELFDVQNMVDIEIRNVDFQEFSVYYDADALGSAEAVQNVLVDDSFVQLNIGTDGDDVITTMNVEAVGAENALALHDEDGLELETLNITGSGTIAIGPDYGGAELNGLTTVDAGANTGGVLVDLRGNTEDLTVTGSSESDLIGLSSGGFTEDDMIDLGEGEFDQVIIDAGDIGALDDNTLDDTVSLTGVEVLGLDGSLDGDTTIELNDFEFTAVNIYGLNSAGAVANDGTPASGSEAFGFTSSDTSDAEAIADTYQGDTLTLDDADDQVVNVYGDNNIQISFTSTDDAALQVGTASDLEAFVEIGNELYDFGYPSGTLSQQQADLEGASAFIDSLDLGNGVETGSLTLNGDLEIDTLIIGEDLESLTASGTGDLIINVGVGDSSNLETIDLSGLTGGFDNIGADPYGEQTFIIGDIGEVSQSTSADFGDGDVFSYSAIGLGDQAETGEFALGTDTAPGSSPNLGDGVQDVVEFTTDFDSNVAIFNFADSSDAGLGTPDAATDDLLDFSALGIDYADLDIAQTDDGAAITSDAFGGAILLVGVEAVELTQNDFIF